MAEETAAAPHRATARVLEVLSLLAAHDEGLSFSELCRAVGAPKGSLFPILKTMVDMRFLSLDAATGRYRMGPMTAMCGRAFERGDGTFRLLDECARGVVAACGETCQVGCRDGSRVRYLLRVDSPQAVRLASAPGATLPLYSTAIGKALLSAMDDGEVDALVPTPWERLTDETLDSPDQLHAELDEVRAGGFAFDRGETSEGIVCIALPVHEAGRVAWGIGVTTPSFRFDAAKGRLIEDVLAKARDGLEALLA